jgi:hypothetical protein
MNAREQTAVRLLDRQFGIGAPDAHVILRTDAAARRIYDCAFRALYELLDDGAVVARALAMLEQDRDPTAQVSLWPMEFDSGQILGIDPAEYEQRPLPPCHIRQWGADEKYCSTCERRWPADEDSECPKGGNTK